MSNNTTLEGLEPWKYLWRKGIIPNTNRKALESLKEALEKDLIVNGQTIDPLNNCCPIAHLYNGDTELKHKIDSVDINEGGDLIEDFFGEMADKCDKSIGEIASIRHFTNWWDDEEVNREERKAELIKEINYNLSAIGGLAV